MMTGRLPVRVSAALGIALLGLTALLPSADALAQERQRISYRVPAENTTYPRQLAIEVADTPGHQLRVFEIHRTFPADAPVINGIKLKEIWTSGISDYVDYNGPSFIYATYLLDNGDKFFVRATVLGQATSTGKRESTTVGTITGGTGRFTRIQGVVRGSNLADPKAGLNENQTEIEYWFAK
jgi:hypothetical protein